MHRKAQRTDFGEEVARFSFDRNLPLTEIRLSCAASLAPMA